jgi:phytanoyl-CoA hydroxylase
MNLQDLPSSRYPDFRQFGVNALTHANIQQVVSALFDGPGKLMHTMYFEGNQATWAHQDSYYIDAEEFGRMVGIWIALEDIQPGAGRFYVYPRSHRLEVPSKPPSDPNHQVYKDHVVRMISESGLECWAPAMRKGDAILWSGKTIHGSLPTLTPEFSRSAVTAHYIPLEQAFLALRSNVLRLSSREVNGMLVHTHYDLDLWRNRMGFWLQGRFPRLSARGLSVYHRLRGVAQPSRRPPEKS